MPLYGFPYRCWVPDSSPEFRLLKRLYQILGRRTGGRRDGRCSKLSSSHCFVFFVGGVHHLLLLFCLRYIPGGPIIRLSKVSVRDVVMNQ